MNRSHLPKTRGNWRIEREALAEDFGLFRTTKSLRVNPRSGAEYEFFLIDGLNWANIIAVTEEKQIVLVKQYRHGKEDYTLELPGGCIEQGEDPKLGILRELREESGYHLNDAEFLGSYDVNPAMMSIKGSFYIGFGAVLRFETEFDPGENIEVILMPFEELLQKALSGEMSHGLQVTALFLARLKGLL